MAYGNLTPPEMPPYDASVYTNVLLVFAYELGAEDWHLLTMYYSAEPFVYDTTTGTVTNAEGLTRCRVYSADTGVWTEEQVVQDALAVRPGGNGGVYLRIWTLKAIKNETGSSWLYAEYVTREKCDLRTWLSGLVTGLGAQIGGGV